MGEAEEAAKIICRIVPIRVECIVRLTKNFIENIPVLALIEEGADARIVGLKKEELI